MSKKQLKLFAVIVAASLAACALLSAAAYYIAISVNAPIEYKDFEGIDVQYEDNVFTITVDSKAGGLFCSSFKTSVDDDGKMYLTIYGVPTASENSTFTASFTVPDGVKEIRYKYKHEETKLRTIVYNTED